jgi:hypothetical protein
MYNTVDKWKKIPNPTLRLRTLERMQAFYSKHGKRLGHTAFNEMVRLKKELGL